ncbi:Gfo/Idh/MocA family oxidoreductase [Anaerolineae bacterium CFX7]|nr:Gfo/Idh/MocA family oxidoreductase [Anaerolineae bacterium CFX7]
MTNLCAAVVGLAWGQMHLDALRRVKNLEIVAVCDSNAERAQTIAKNAGIKNFFTDARQVFARADVDLVTLATPPATHVELAHQALLAQKMVLCEAPVGLSSGDAAKLFKTAQQRKMASAVAFQTRYLPSYAYAQELIAEDYLGTFLRATVSFQMAQPWGFNGNWAADEKRGGGVMRNIAVHFIDALLWWFGPAERVMATRETLFSQVRRPLQVGRETKIEKFTATADDAFTALVEFQNGGTALLNFVTGVRQDAPWQITLVGSRATLQITSGALSGKRDTERDFGQLQIPRRLELPDRPREPLMWALTELVTDLKQMRGETSNGRKPPTFQDAANAYRVMEAIQRSSDDRLWTNVERG